MNTTTTLNQQLKLANLVLAFGRVNRATLHPDGKRPETDAEHTLMLGICALTFAAQHPELGLDLGLLAQLALVHDIPEVYAGDTNTAGGLTPEQAKDKMSRETDARRRLLDEFGDCWLNDALLSYDLQESPESRFLRYFDKILPKLTHALNNGASIKAMGKDGDWLRAAHDAQSDALALQYPELRRWLGRLFDVAAWEAERVYDLM